MPFEKEVRRFYNGAAWRKQRARILERAQLEHVKGPTCECRGHCGREHFCNETHMQKGTGVGVRKGARVVIGVAHKNHRSGEHVSDDELIALCSGCHLRYDIEQHIRARPRNRARRLERRGQRRLVFE